MSGEPAATQVCEDRAQCDETGHSPHQASRTWLLVSICVFCISLVVLWWNAAPSVTFHDSGEFAMAAASAGIPHPPGAPTWTMLASAFVRLGGFQDPARGTNLFSALCAALTLAMLCGLTQVWASRLFPSSPRWLSAAAGVGAALILLRSPAFLEQSFTTEQYTLLTALLVAIMAVATAIAFRSVGTAGDSTLRPRTWLCILLGLLWGLAIGNHLSQISLGLLVAWAVWVGARRETRMRDLLRLGGACAGGLLLGLLVFLWVPIRSHANPLIDWGNVKTLNRFIWAITRQQWPSRPMSEAPPGFVSDWIASYDLVGQLGAAGLLLTGIGLVALVKKSKLWLGWLAVITIPYAVLLLLGHMRQRGMDVTYICAYGIMDWHLPIYLAAAAAAATGISAVVSGLYRCGATRVSAALAVVLLAWLSITAGLAVKQSSLRDFHAPEEFLAAVLAPLPEDAILIVEQDNLAFNLSYLNYISHPGSKRWVAFRGEPVSYFLAQAGRADKGWNDELRTTYLTVTTMEPDKQPLRVPPLSPERARCGRVFSDFSPVFHEDAGYLVPAGLLFEVVGRPTTDEEVREAERRWRREFPGLLKEPSGNSHRLERHAWAVMYRQRGAFFAERNMWPQAADQYARSLEWIGNDAQIWFCLGHSLDQSGRFDQAVQAYERAIELAPYLPEPRGNLAVMYAEAGQLEKAERLLVEALKVDPNSKTERANLAMVRSQLRQR